MLNRKLGRKKDHRNHMLRNLAASVILYEKVVTTEAKAKEIRKLIDRSITTAKKNSLAARRTLIALYFDPNVVKKLFEVLIERYADRPSGFTQVLRLGNRFGDNANKSMISLIGKTKTEPIAKPTDKVAVSAKETDHAEAK